MSYICVAMNYLTTKQTAEKLGVTVGRVRQMVIAGQLSAERFGRDLMINETAIKAVSNRKTGRPKKAESNGEINGNEKPKSFAEAASKYIGAIKDGLPSDLSTNKEYLKDLGRKSLRKEGR